MRSRLPTLGRGTLKVAAAALLAATSVVSAPPAGGVAGFGDVEPLPAFYTRGVQWMVNEGITAGVTPTCFAPYAAVTRGQAAAFMWRMQGRPTPTTPHGFVDVLQSWQQTPVSWMVEGGITFGTTATTFEPERALNRGEFAALLWRLDGEPVGSPPHPFVDVLQAWQNDPISWMFDNAITLGTTETTFSPDQTITRGQVATFLYRYQGEPAVVVDNSHPTAPLCPDQVPAPPPGPSTPFLVGDGIIVTRPFAGTSTKMFDGEALAFVPSDDTLWLADDNAIPGVLYEIDRSTGTPLGTIDGNDLAAAPRFGGGPVAGIDRTGDLESLAYDPVDDHIYVVSGGCCGANDEPAVFRLTRTGPGATFEVESYQPLPDGARGAAATPAGELYLGEFDLRTFDYEANAFGAPFKIPGVTGIVQGMGFSSDGMSLFVVNHTNMLWKVDWASKTIVDGHQFSLDPFLGDGRGVEFVGDRLYIQDGDDSLTTTDPLKYAVHIFRIDGTT